MRTAALCWLTGQDSSEAKALSDDEFWAEYAKYWEPNRYSFLVRIEASGHTVIPAERELDRRLARSKTLRGHRTGACRVEGQGKFKPRPISQPERETAGLEEGEG